MVVVKVGIIIVFGFAMVPHWNFANISAFPEASVFFRDVLLTIPFCFFSAVFIQVLNPMNIAYRKRVADRVLATYGYTHASDQLHYADCGHPVFLFFFYLFH
jgi:amino acid permease